MPRAARARPRRFRGKNRAAARVHGLSRMWITRYALPFAIAVAVLLASLAPRAAGPSATISARELLDLAQHAGGANYTFSHATGTALEGAAVARPEADAGLPQLESALIGAGFRLRRVDAGERDLFLVEPSGR